MLFWRRLTVGAALLLALSPSTAHAWAVEQPTSYAAHLAGQLAEDPVYVSDHYAGVLDLAETRSRIRDSVSLLDYPVYVMVLPTVLGGTVLDEGFLAAVRDRLGEDGVYLLAEYRGSGITAAAYGVDAPAADAALEVLFALDYDTPLPVVVDRFVDNLASGESAERLEEMRERWADDYEQSSGPSLIDRIRRDLSSDSPTGVRNQAFAIGTALGAAATLLLLHASRFLWRSLTRPVGGRR